jgi:predicted unusual protein kinase regulating ubiquinone biosynthesis (AarF/ABC1/UbiB family)
MALYGDILRDIDIIKVPGVVKNLSTGRLITMDWAEGLPLMEFTGRPQEIRNFLVEALFTAWWLPFNRFGVIHGDPHLGNYTAIVDDRQNPIGLNLLDFGCIRLFPPAFVRGVVDLYHGLLHGDDDKIVHAYQTWGFKNLDKELIEILNIWAGFIYGPLLDDRVRALADGVNPAHYGRREAYRVHQALKEKGPVTVPREFVFMDRAAIGLGGVFLRLGAKLNFYRLFNETLGRFDFAALAARQDKALKRAGLALD